MRQRIEQHLTGAMNTRRRTPLPVRVGPTPPAWWVDDSDASDDNFRAMSELDQLRG